MWTVRSAAATEATAAAVIAAASMPKRRAASARWPANGYQGEMISTPSDPSCVVQIHHDAVAELHAPRDPLVREPDVERVGLAVVVRPHVVSLVGVPARSAGG